MKNCPIGTDRNNNSKTCAICHYSCLACAGPEDFACIMCDPITRIENNFTYNMIYQITLGYCSCLSFYYEIYNEPHFFRKYILIFNIFIYKIKLVTILVKNVLVLMKICVIVVQIP